MLFRVKIYNMTTPHEAHIATPSLVESPASSEEVFALGALVKDFAGHGRSYSIGKLLADHDHLAKVPLSEQVKAESAGLYAEIGSDNETSSDRIRLISYGPAGIAVLNTGLERKPGLIIGEIRLERLTTYAELSAQLLLLNDGRGRLEGLCRLRALIDTTDVTAIDEFAERWGLQDVWNKYTASQLVGSTAHFEGLMSSQVTTRATTEVQKSAELFG